MYMLQVAQTKQSKVEIQLDVFKTKKKKKGKKKSRQEDPFPLKCIYNLRRRFIHIMFL